MFCTFVSLEWKTILLQSTLPTRWPSLDTRSMHPNQWHRGKWGMVRMCPRWCKHIQLQGYSHLISCVLDIAHTAHHKQSKCRYLLSKSPRLQWGALRVRDSNIRIQTENSSPSPSPICSILSSVGRVLATDSHFIASCSCLLPSSWGWPSRDRVINIHYNRSHSSIQQLL